MLLRRRLSHRDFFDPHTRGQWSEARSPFSRRETQLRETEFGSDRRTTDVDPVPETRLTETAVSIPSGGFESRSGIIMFKSIYNHRSIREDR